MCLPFCQHETHLQEVVELEAVDTSHDEASEAEEAAMVESGHSWPDNHERDSLAALLCFFPVGACALRQSLKVKVLYVCQVSPPALAV